MRQEDKESKDLSGQEELDKPLQEIFDNDFRWREDDGSGVFISPEEVRSASYLLEKAWTLIANAGGGNWDTELRRWKKSAETWREEYFAWLKDGFDALGTDIDYEPSRDELNPPMEEEALHEAIMRINPELGDGTEEE